MLKLAQRLLLGATGVIDRQVGWWRLPCPASLLVLGGIRRTLRESNLFDVDSESIPYGTREPLPPDRSLSRAYNGTGTSLRQPGMGAAGAVFGRNVPVPTLTPTAVLRPNPRTISRELLARSEFRPATTLNVLAAAWLQFQIHDWLSHEPPDGSPWRIPLESDDPWPERPMLVYRTPPAHPGEAANVFRNTETHWWDGSQLYGSTEAIGSALREFAGGRMLLTDDGLVPFDPNSGRDLAGVTGNWWLGLAMLHTLFLREHNSICEMLESEHPTWSDDELFNHARLINAALMARIQTLDWSMAVVANKAMQLPLGANWWGLVGERVTRRVGRLSSLDLISGAPGSHADLFGVPYSITEEFVAVYRMHQLLPDDYVLRDHVDNHVLQELTFGDLSLGSTRKVLDSVAMEDLIYSFAQSNPGVIGLHNYPRALTSFRKPDGTIIDLATTELVRDRERGVPRYNEFRRRFHLSAAGRFEDISKDPQVVEKLSRIYDSPEDVDLTVGLLAEEPVSGFAFSDTAFRMFALMATRRLKSDRFFTDDYRPEVYTQAGLDWVADNSMSSVILRHYPSLADSLRGVENPFMPWGCG
jgi:hypothetical protein